jgi:hypothetical protein
MADKSPDYNVNKQTQLLIFGVVFLMFGQTLNLLADGEDWGKIASVVFSIIAAAIIGASFSFSRKK